MILKIQYQCAIKTNERSESDPHAVKAKVYPAGDGDLIEKSWNLSEVIIFGLRAYRREQKERLSR